MTKLTSRQWLEIKTKYQMGKPIRAIAREYNYDSGNLTRKAKKERWTHGEIQQIISTQANIINVLIENTAVIQQKITLEQHQIIFNEILLLAGIRELAYNTQFEMLNLVNKIIEQVAKMLEDNPSGLYVKSKSDKAITFGRNSEMIKDLAPAMSSINAIINI